MDKRKCEPPAKQTQKLHIDSGSSRGSIGSRLFMAVCSLRWYRAGQLAVWSTEKTKHRVPKRRYLLSCSLSAPSLSTSIKSPVRLFIRIREQGQMEAGETKGKRILSQWWRSCFENSGSSNLKALQGSALVENEQRQLRIIYQGNKSEAGGSVKMLVKFVFFSPFPQAPWKLL